LYSQSANLTEQQSYQHNYDNSFRKAGMFSRGGVFFFRDFDELSFAPGGEVTFGGKVMDAVLLTVPEDGVIGKPAMMKLTASFLAGHIVFPDNPIYAILNNKSLLAMLHEPSLLQQLPSTEQAFIHRYVPWTAKVNQQQVSYQYEGQNEAQSVHLPTLLADNKDLFVLKKSLSAAGRDVYIGAFMDQPQWLECIDKVKDDNGWLVQRFCKADKVVATSGNSTLGVYDMVWGVFDLDNSYSGAFIRAKASDQSSGIINLANGAIGMTVYEEPQSKKRKLIL
jgi:hypothetical protein